MSKVIRVIQFGVGPIGAEVVKLMLKKPGLKITGAIDIDPQKAGRDLGRTVGLDREIGVQISADAAAVLAQPAEVVLHTTSSSLRAVADQLMACLRAGKHVISTCEELSYPFRKHPDLSRTLDQAAREHNVALLGTGVNPGFAMDKLILTLATACQEVRRAAAHRVVDAAQRRLPLQKKVGAGLTADEFRKQVAEGKIKHHGLPESVAMVADALGISVDRIDEVIEPVVAKDVVRSKYMEIKAGLVAGVHQVARGFSGHREAITLDLEMYLGAQDPMDSVLIEGKPNLRMTIEGGIHGDLATAAIAVNCIPAMFEVQPGLRTPKDMPMCFFPGAGSKSAFV